MAKKKNEEIEAEKPAIPTESLEDKYNRLIAEIKPHLITKAQLRQGGSANRSRYEKERGYAAVITEINDIGKQIGMPKIGLGHLRG